MSDRDVAGYPHAMSPERPPAWPLPVMALFQVYVAMVLISPLREPGARWDAGYAALAAIAGVGGLAILSLAVRNCGRLWRVPAQEASWSLVAAAGLTALYSAMWATGPLTLGVWHWSSLVPAALAAYLLVVVAREIRRRAWRRRRLA